LHTVTMKGLWKSALPIRKKTLRVFFAKSKRCVRI